MATNYERITESPEKLADFLSTIYGVCAIDYDMNPCPPCPLKDVRWCFKKASILEWLKEEVNG